MACFAGSHRIGPAGGASFVTVGAFGGELVSVSSSTS